MLIYISERICSISVHASVDRKECLDQRIAFLLISYLIPTGCFLFVCIFVVGKNHKLILFKLYFIVLTTFKLFLSDL